LSFQEAENASSKSNTESLNKSFEQTDQFIDERREREETSLKPNNSQIIQQTPLKFRFKKSNNPKFLNPFPQLAFQNNIYYFYRKMIRHECLNYLCKICLYYRCENHKQHCNGYIQVSFDQKVIEQSAHSCTGNIDNATIVSLLSKMNFIYFFINFL
jgi:hypothetical protein